MITRVITVIADDFTGAAEIAGIGLRFGLRVNLATDITSLPDCELLVIATDTRSMSEAEAIRINRKLSRTLKQFGCNKIFKKTDSALRGHILPELKAVMESSGHRRALLLPENPSRGRIVRDGVYYINETPLHHTPFTDDPEFPAHSSTVSERFPGVHLVNHSGEMTETGICFANAVVREDIKQFIRHSDSGILLAGAADLFTTYLQSEGYAAKKDNPVFQGLQERNTIIICGSTVSGDLSGFPYVSRKGIRMHTMPTDVFEGGDYSRWSKKLMMNYNDTGSIALAVGYRSKGGKNFALRLRNTMAELVYKLISFTAPDEVIIEGGATAFAVLKRLGWSSFVITNEITPGVVRMALKEDPRIHITVKPGSYPWGEYLFQ
ncbi:MAG: four-carbon acid sugar kinase family protein [Bacteroides sp.]|nr:four-carbon acid sugar kinase family protein [Bacteroides sp.]